MTDAAIGISEEKRSYGLSHEGNRRVDVAVSAAGFY